MRVCRYACVQARSAANTANPDENFLSSVPRSQCVTLLKSLVWADATCCIRLRAQLCSLCALSFCFDHARSLYLSLSLPLSLALSFFTPAPCVRWVVHVSLLPA